MRERDLRLKPRREGERELTLEKLMDILRNTTTEKDAKETFKRLTGKDYTED